MPPIPGLADVRPWDNRSITAAKQLPRRLLVLGGGAIGAEMAQAFRRLGCDEVTVVEGGPRLIAREEPFAGDELAAAFEAEGISVITGVSMSSARRAGTDGPVVGTLADGREIEADELLVAVGRRPATASLGLDAVGLEPGRFVDVDDRLRATGVSGGWLYAVGDCNGRALLTHMGKYQARIASDVIAGRDARDEASASVVPRVTFTDPQVCAVGLTEAQAREQGLRRPGGRVRHGGRRRCLHPGERHQGHEQAGHRRGPAGHRRRHVHRARSAGAAALGHRRRRRSGPPRAAVARRTVVPDRQ